VPIWREAKPLSWRQISYDAAPDDGCHVSWIDVADCMVALKPIGAAGGFDVTVTVALLLFALPAMFVTRTQYCVVTVRGGCIERGVVRPHRR
jgi:hypothetical protein